MHKISSLHGCFVLENVGMAIMNSLGSCCCYSFMNISHCQSDIDSLLLCYWLTEFSYTYNIYYTYWNVPQAHTSLLQIHHLHKYILRQTPFTYYYIYVMKKVQRNINIRYAGVTNMHIFNEFYLLSDFMAAKYIPFSLFIQV